MGQLGGLDVDRAMYLLRIAMRDFMMRNSTRIEPHFFLHFSQNFPKLSWMLMPGTYTPSPHNPPPPLLGCLSEFRVRLTLLSLLCV